MPVYRFNAQSNYQHLGSWIVIPRWELIPEAPDKAVFLLKWLQEGEDHLPHSFWQIKRGDERDFYEFIPYTCDLFMRSRLEVNEFGDFPMAYVGAAWAERGAKGKRYTGRVEHTRRGDMPVGPEGAWEFVGGFRTYEFINKLAKQFKNETELYEHQNENPGR